MRTMRGLGAALASAGLLAILVLTLFPNPRQAGVADHTSVLCVVCGDAGGADVFLNLLLFMPMAAGLALLGWPWARVVVACAALSLAVETAQYFPLTGRDASLSDVLTNTTSGALGAALGSRFGLLLAPGPALARRLSLVGAAAWLAAIVVTGFSMRPWTPSGRLDNYCTPSFPTAEVFTGTARTMTLNGVALSCDGGVPNGAAIRRELGRGEIVLETVARAAPPSDGRRLIHVVRTPTASLVTLAQHGRAAVFQAPTAAQALRLFPPSLQLSRAFPAEAGATVELAARAEGRKLLLSAVHDGERGSAELALSPSYGWTLVFAVPLAPGPTLRLVAALWLAVLILPAAYWAWLAERRIATVGALGGVVIAGLGLVPAVTGFDPVHRSEWLGAATGVALGWALSRIATYLQSRCGSPSTSAYSSS